MAAPLASAAANRAPAIRAGARSFVSCGTDGVPAAAPADALARLERIGMDELRVLQARLPPCPVAPDPIASVIEWDLACS